MQNLKVELYQKCVEFIKNRVDSTKEAMENAQKAANAESKSSMGDKYETTRAMMQIERDKNAAQLSEAMKLHKVLQSINPQIKCDKAKLGALVVTKEECFYISISIGLIEVEGKKCYVISPVTPIGKLLEGKVKGDRFMFKGQECTILDIS